MNPDDDIKVQIPVQVPVMASVIGGRCAWTVPAMAPITIRRIDAADMKARDAGRRTPAEVHLHEGRVYSPVAGHDLAATVDRLRNEGLAELGAKIPDEFMMPEDKRSQAGRRGAALEFGAQALAALARDPAILVHDGSRIYRAWRRGPIFELGPGIAEPPLDFWNIGYSPGRSEDHYRWCVASNGSASRNATEAVERAERSCDPDLLAAMPTDADVLHFMERAPMQMLGKWKHPAHGASDTLGERLRELAGLGLAMALDEGDRFEHLKTIREAAASQAHGRRHPHVKRQAEFILHWCEVVAIPRFIASPVLSDDLDAVSGLAP